jgi:hypothetical protein
MDATTAVTLFGLGSAALALWLVARFPERGPQTVRSSSITFIVVLIVQTPCVRLIHPMADAYGVPAALLLVILPTLTLLFWSVACLLKSFVALMAPYRR